MSIPQSVGISFSCFRVRRGDPEAANARIPDLLMQEVFDKVEELKSRNGFAKVEGEGYPLIISVISHVSTEISNVRISGSIWLNLGDKSALQGVEEFDFGIPVLKSRELYEIVILNMAGVNEARISVLDAVYSQSDGSKGKCVTSAPFLVRLSDLSNEYNGFKDEKTRERHFLLRNYQDNSKPLRGILLNLMFQAIEDINKQKFVLKGSSRILVGEDLAKIRGAIQVDIISKIMMYIEDLIILLDSHISSEGDYYRLLDRRDSSDMDLGDRIKKFMTRLDSQTECFSYDEYRRMLSYADPTAVSPTDFERRALEKRIQQNVDALKSFLLQIRKFGKAHGQIFRRYKHAGLAMRPGLTSEKYPNTDEKFDSVVMVFVGKNPLKDVVPLPYSSAVIRAYSCIIATIQQFLCDIVENAISCIERDVDGIIPIERYGATPETTSDDSAIIIPILSKFVEQNPLRAFDSLYLFKGNFPRDDPTISWYGELPKLLEQCEKNRPEMSIQKPKQDAST